MNRLFALLMLSLSPVVVMAQTAAKDSSGRDLLLQIEVLTQQIDSIRTVALAKNKVANEFSSKSHDAAVRLHKEREATHYDRQVFIDTFLNRILLVGNAEFIARTILQFAAISESMGKALSVHTPDEIKQIDTLKGQYMAIDKQREAAWRAYDDELIKLDSYMERLDALKKSMYTKADK